MSKRDKTYRKKGQAGWGGRKEAKAHKEGLDSVKKEIAKQLRELDDEALWKMFVLLCGELND